MSPFSKTDRLSVPPTVSVPRAYNASVDFIDRHLVEGRGGKVAVRDDGGTYSYAQLAERVNRAGNMMKTLG
ncbi:MAG TPA: benzoate-CoA ligase family protein, partial [Alphaproteobacteria bacterium]